MDALASHAIAAAVEVAEHLGLRVEDPFVLKDGSNVLVHLRPQAIVARVSTTTSWIRRPAEVWLERDLEIGRYLESIAFPAVRPAREVPAGPHRSSAATGELALSFWKYVEEDGQMPVSAEEGIHCLASLHAALHSYPGELPFMGLILEEIPHWLRWLENGRHLSGMDATMLRESQWRLATRIRSLRMPVQPLHGDAHARNLIRTRDGKLLWTDFEDACKGPVAWDVATMIAREPERAEELLALYPGGLTWHEVAPFAQARTLEAAVYAQVLAVRFPARAGEAQATLEEWAKRRVA